MVKMPGMEVEIEQASIEPQPNFSVPALSNSPEKSPGKITPSQPANELTKVFALGAVYYDLGNTNRRLSLMQSMNANPDDPGALLAFLEKNPAQAASIIWTLHLEGAPIYAIQPGGSFASMIYEQLRQFLREQLMEGVERVSLSGVIIGKVKLLTGQEVPLVFPEERCMFSWSTAALVEAVSGKPPAGSAKAADVDQYNQKTSAVANFLERAYYELRNLGDTSKLRAINFAATSGAQRGKSI